MDNSDLIIALGRKWRTMPDDDKKLAVALALDALLQEHYRVESVYGWPAIRAKLAKGVCKWSAEKKKDAPKRRRKVGAR